MSYTWTDQDFDELVAQSRAQTPPIDPAEALLVLFEESGANPASPGPAAAKPPVGGLNQMSVPNLTNLGLTRAQWLAMTAAEQLPWVFRWWASLNHFNDDHFAADAAELLGLNFLPGAFANAGAGRNPDAPIAGRLGPYAWAYKDNPLLQNETGSITVNTLRAYLAKVAAHGGVVPSAAGKARWLSLLAGVHAANERAGSIEPGNPPDGGQTPPPSSSPPPAPGGGPSFGGGGLASLFLAAGILTWLAMRGRIGGV